MASSGDETWVSPRNGPQGNQGNHPRRACEIISDLKETVASQSDVLHDIQDELKQVKRPNSELPGHGPRS